MIIPENMHAASTREQWSFRLQEPSPRFRALAQKSASMRDNWFSDRNKGNRICDSVA
jgi:hypothetical protein